MPSILTLMLLWIPLEATVPNDAFEIRVADEAPVPFPVDRFSVRQMNAIHFAGRYYAYADVVPWDNPHHPNTYNTSIHAYSSDDGLRWRYEGEVLPKGEPGDWDAGGVATPGVCVSNGKILLAYSGRERQDGGGQRSIGLAGATEPLGPFTKRPKPILTAHGHLDDPLLLPWSGDDRRVLLYFRWAAGQHGYRSQLAESHDAGETWGKPTTVLHSHGDVRAMETLDAKWIDGQIILAQLEHFHRGPHKVALYASSDGRVFVPCRKKYLNDYLKLPLRLAYGPILTFIPNADGRIEHIGLTALTDTAGHYTQFVCRLRLAPGR